TAETAYRPATNRSRPAGEQAPPRVYLADQASSWAPCQLPSALGTPTTRSRHGRCQDRPRLVNKTYRDESLPARRRRLLSHRSTSTLAWFLLAFSGPLWARLSVSTTQGSSPSHSRKGSPGR